MKRLAKFVLPILLFVVLFTSCGKNEDIQPDSTFTAEVDNNLLKIVDTKTTINKGITIIVGSDRQKEIKNIFVVTIRGIEEGTYKQEFDYKTGVSVAQCSMTMKTISKEQTKLPDYFISYEGNVEISNINHKSKTISGTYSFRVKSIPESKKLDLIEGNFYNLSYN